MSNVLRRIGLISLAFIIAITVMLYPQNVSASNGEPVYQDGTELFQKQLYLGAWCEPCLSEEEFEKYKECGFNVMYLNNKVDYNKRKLVEYLKMGEKKDIKIMLAMGINKEYPRSLKMQKTPLTEYPAFYGVCAVDEPLGSVDSQKVISASADRGIDKDYPTIYDYIYSEYEYLNENYTGKLFESVLAGGGFGELGDGTFPAYKEKVLNKIENASERVVAEDYYPYKVDRSGTPNILVNYLYALYNLAEAGKSVNAGKRICYYQQLWDTDIRDYISAQEITYQLYSSMCFGINGFVAYYYASYWEDYKNINKILMNSAWGEREFNYYNKVALEEVKKFDHIYLDFANNWQGIIKVKGTEYSNDAEGMFNELTAEKFSDGQYVLNSYDRIESVTSSQDSIIGVFKDTENRDGFMISNQSFTLNRKSDTVTIKFKNATKALVTEKGEVKTVDLDNGKYTVTLSPGGGTFVIPY